MRRRTWRWAKLSASRRGGVGVDCGIILLAIDVRQSRTCAKCSEGAHLTEDRMEKSALTKNADGNGEAQLRQLQETQEAQARYMSYLSHDLRGSLNGLVLMVEVLKREIEGIAASTDEILADLAMMKRALVDTVA